MDDLWMMLMRITIYTKNVPKDGMTKTFWVNLIFSKKYFSTTLIFNFSLTSYVQNGLGVHCDPHISLWRGWSAPWNERHIQSK
jgi:hypothetical protein